MTENGQLAQPLDTKSPEDTEEWFPTKNSRQDLEEVQNTRDEFRVWVLTNVRETRLFTMPSREGSKDDKQLPNIQGALSKSANYEEACGFVESFSIISELGNAVQARSELSQKRSRGIRKLGYEFQKFSTTFLQCLRAFKGIVNIAASADPGFVGLAYETLNIFFTVVAMKQKLEEKLTETLEEIKEHLPNLIVYDQIYQNTMLGKKIAAVYKGVIYFSREATRYYITNHGYKRWSRALSGKKSFHPSNLNFKKDLLAVKNQCEVLLSVNIDKLKKLAEAQKKQLDKLLAAASLERLQKFRSYLALPPSFETDLQSSLTSYTHALQSLTSDERVEQLSTADLLSSPEMQTWTTSSTSQLLILAGRNEASTFERDDLSWLSPSAIYLAQKFREKGEKVLHCLSQEESWRPKYLLPQEIVASLLYQLLVTAPQVLQDDSYASLAALLEGKDVKTLDLTVLVDVFTRLLNLQRQGGTIYIVIDRVDRCREDGVRRVALIKQLVRIIKEVKGVVIKVLVVANRVYWEHLEKDLEGMKKEGEFDERVGVCLRDQQMHPDRW